VLKLCENTQAVIEVLLHSGYYKMF
jgi:hypothetical protein